MPVCIMCLHDKPLEYHEGRRVGICHECADKVRLHVTSYKNRGKQPLLSVWRDLLDTEKLVKIRAVTFCVVNDPSAPPAPPAVADNGDTMLVLRWFASVKQGRMPDKYIDRYGDPNVAGVVQGG